MNPSVCSKSDILTGGYSNFVGDYATLGTMYNRNDLGTVRGPPTMAQGVSPVIQLLPGWGGVGNNNPSMLSEIPFTSLRNAYPDYPRSCSNTQSLYQ